MKLSTIFRVLGVFLMVFSLSMTPPIAIALWYNDGAWMAFLIAFLVTLSTGFFMWFYCRHAGTDLKARDGFFIVVLFWSVLSLFGALPLMIAQHPHLSFTNAVFESVSGLTTTGATVISGLDKLPHAILYYRQQLQFFGGMGIIVLAVAILPMLGIGGMQLYRAEIPGPVKDTKLTPRLSHTAKALWYIYVGLTVLCIFAYWAGGMNLFDAIGEGFATTSTGGFSMHDASFGYYHNSILYSIACVFMVLGSTNFALHFAALQKRALETYWKDSEFRAYILIMICSALLAFGILFLYHIYKDPMNAAMQSIFTAVSMTTNTGFTTATFQEWPSLLPIVFMMIGMIGGCAASTSGGIKIVRILLLLKQGSREIKRLIHPNAIITMKLGDRVLPDELLQAVWSYIAVFIMLFMVLTLILLACGLDLKSAQGAVIACLSNLGVAVGEHLQSFSNLNLPSKWSLIFAMIAGRLEIFSLLVLFSPAFWRQ